MDPGPLCLWVRHCMVEYLLGLPSLLQPPQPPSTSFNLLQPPQPPQPPPASSSLLSLLSHTLFHIYSWGGSVRVPQYTGGWESVRSF